MQLLFWFPALYLHYLYVALVGAVVSALGFDPQVAGSNPVGKLMAQFFEEIALKNRRIALYGISGLFFIIQSLIR